MKKENKSYLTINKILDWLPERQYDENCNEYTLQIWKAGSGWTAGYWDSSGKCLLMKQTYSYGSFKKMIETLYRQVLDRNKLTKNKKKGGKKNENTRS